MPLTEPWTLERLDRLPDDENRYELVDGELLVTPPPSDVHEAIADWFGALLGPFVRENRLGSVQRPRAVVQVGDERTEPDLMVRADAPLRGWANAPVPILVVEVLSRAPVSGTSGRSTTSIEGSV
jgi:Uma2 family endonuclease